MKTQKLSSSGNIQIYSVHYPSKTECKGSVLWIHGFAEYCDRYIPVWEFLANHGYESYALDLRGHGNSSGTRGYILSIQDYFDDIISVWKHYNLLSKQNLIMFGHSMGGLVTLRFRQEYHEQYPVKATILSSPFLGINVPVPSWKKLLSKVIVNLYPQISIPSGIDSKNISHDSAIVKAYENDPKVFKTATAGWFEAMTAEFDNAFKLTAQTKGPLHFLMAGDDKLVNPAQTKLLYSKLPEIEKSLKVYEGFYHEILNETGKAEVYQDVLNLLNTYCPDKPSDIKSANPIDNSPRGISE